MSGSFGCRSSFDYLVVHNVHLSSETLFQAVGELQTEVYFLNSYNFLQVMQIGSSQDFRICNYFSAVVLKYSVKT